MIPPDDITLRRWANAEADDDGDPDARLAGRQRRGLTFWDPEADCDAEGRW